MQDSVNQDRWKYIGGSDIPAIMGISPFKTRFELLQEKARIKENPFDGNVYTRYGQEMEGAIRDYINKTIGAEEGFEFLEGKQVEEGDPIGYRCHTDGESKLEILEVKTTSSDNIHDDLDAYGVYLVQELFYMERRKRSFGTLAVYERPSNFMFDMDEYENEEEFWASIPQTFDPKRLHIYRFCIDEYQSLVDKINLEVERFIEDLKRMIENPNLTEEDLMPAEVVELSSQIVAFENKLAQMKEIEEGVKKMKDELKELMIKHNVKKWVTPNGYQITRVDDTPASTSEEEYLDIDSIKRDLPELWRSEFYGGYMKTHTVTKKGRKGYVLITPPKE